MPMSGLQSRPHRTGRCVRVRIRQPTSLSPRTHACQPCRVYRVVMGMCGVRRLSLTSRRLLLADRPLPPYRNSLPGCIMVTFTRRRTRVRPGRRPPTSVVVVGRHSRPQMTARCVRVRMRQPTSLSPPHPCICRLSLTPPCSTTDPSHNLQKLAAGVYDGFIYTSP